MFGRARYSKRARTPLRGGPEASRDWPWDAFGRLRAALGSPRAFQDRPRGEFWASRSRPERVPARSRNGSERSKPPKMEFSSIFRRSCPIFDRFSVDFPSIFVRLARCDFCFFFARSLTAIDKQNTENRKNAQVSRPSSVWPFELACTTCTIHPTACGPTLYLFDQASPT